MMKSSMKALQKLSHNPTAHSTAQNVMDKMRDVGYKMWAPFTAGVVLSAAAIAATTNELPEYKGLRPLD